MQYINCGKIFFVKTLVGTVSLSFFIDILDKLEPLTEDRILACVYGGIVTGLGTAILLKVASSTGGSDLLGNIIKGFNNSVRVGNMIILIDIIIVSLNMVFFKEIEVGLYSAIAIYIMGKIIDIIFEGVYFTKLLIIISDKSEEIAKAIGKNIKRGTTGLYGKGMYTNDEKLVLMCAASRGDVSKVKETAKKIDPKSFIVITNSREVVGLGFKRS